MFIKKKEGMIRHLMGFVKAQEGSLSINGKDCWESSAIIKHDIGYLPGELAFPKDMTGNQFIQWMADKRQLSDMTKTDELKEIFEVDGSEAIKEMSLGDRRKLAVVTAFMHSPKVLILDEPSSGLDPVMQEPATSSVKSTPPVTGSLSSRTAKSSPRSKLRT